MIDPRHFRLYVIRPTLEFFDPGVPYSVAAENLLLGTALVESRLEKLRQVGGGPARGVFQVEPATHTDVWDNWLAYKAGIREKILVRFGNAFAPSPDRLETDLAYATLIARLVYRRSPALLPAANDALALARLHKQVYNTAAGKTKVSESVEWFKKVVAHGEYGPS